MKALLKSSMIMSTIFATSVMTSSLVDQDLINHPVEGNMSSPTMTITYNNQSPENLKDFAADITTHPVEGYLVASRDNQVIAATDCMNSMSLSGLQEHPIEGDLGVVRPHC